MGRQPGGTFGLGVNLHHPGGFVGNSCTHGQDVLGGDSSFVTREQRGTLCGLGRRGLGRCLQFYRSRRLPNFMLTTQGYLGTTSMCLQGVTKVVCCGHGRGNIRSFRWVPVGGGPKTMVGRGGLGRGEYTPSGPGGHFNGRLRQLGLTR